MRPWRTEALVLVAALALLVGAARPVRAEMPLARSFTAAGLARVSALLGREVTAGRIPGAILLIQQHGKPVLFETFGLRNVKTAQPMTDDTIFRLYSMSKPITSVAAMMLVEDGKLALDDAVAKYIPAFADVQVGVPAADGGLALQPLAGPITVRDLLRHTSGITYGFYGDSPVRRLYAQAGLFDGDPDNAEFVARLARLPLAEQPGTLWDYGHSTDVLGRVIEVVSGLSLYQFEKQRLLDPLAMRDTAFFVADEARRPRIAEPLPGDWFDRPVAGITEATAPRRWESGGAGMVGTIRDYARFTQMLLNGGELDGRRYLRRETVALMTSDQIGKGSGVTKDPGFYFPGRDSGFGLGFAVRIMADGRVPAGEYRWDGVGGTFFFIDPADDMFVICMMQSPAQRGPIQDELKRLVYGALVR
ncbi:serine hydrolase domain-containing protein [Bradyrhizobium guangdongense]|uniref:Serine hydrolase n=1 Tax=Bradyrhizobium guangdongense TaxID=1325090 RepID=A0A410V5C3_9BRAD|nr:serine hydrolase domain-containing protein [Bradyrhizobium guangdongense]QAU38852.1 serine hydrolase [Bradyrhizobium guangdongense]QOZ59910.1 serine hydrolase [Bradyrhizobium guangdongense]GGI23204.1 serine hydrolase [Bradyrhizobium guangdongense]